MKNLKKYLTKHHAKNPAKNILGLVLTEALVGVAVAATGAIIATTVITNAVSTTTTSKDYLVAQNLVTEAVESVKNIRDTNWLRRPDMKECWLMADPNTRVTDGTTCSSSSATNMTARDFIVNWDSSNNTWRLETPAANSQLNLSDDLGNYEAYRLYEDSSNNTGGGSTTRFVPGNPDSDREPSKFYRSVNFQNVVTEEGATVIVKIQWKDGSKVRSITRQVNLSNYL